MAAGEGNARIIIDLEARRMAEKAMDRVANHEQLCSERQRALLDKLKDMSDDSLSLGEKIDGIKSSGTKQLLALVGGLVSICGVLIWNFVIHPH